MSGNSERANRKLKFFDRYFGIPAVVLLGLYKKAFRRKYQLPQKNCTIGILNTAAIGDTILMAGIVSDIKIKYPESRIVFFTGASNFEIGKLIIGITEVVKLPIANPLEAIRGIRGYGPFDVWIDCGPWPRLNSILSFFSGAKYTIGFKTASEYRHYCYDRYVEHSFVDHELLNYRALLNSIGIPTGSLPSLNIVSQRNNNTKYVVMHMCPGGSRAYLKLWENDRWVSVADYFTQNGFEVYLTGAPKDNDYIDTIRLQCARPGMILSKTGLSLHETGELLINAAMVISVDTGIMHMASALQCNLIVLHGPTSPKRWGALNSNAISISAQLTCSPCISLGFEKGCGVNNCMKKISVEEVVKAAATFLKESK